jgi:hypothetical protein
MPDLPTTLAELLLETPPTAGAKRLLQKAKLSDLRARVDKLPGITWSTAADMLANAICESLDVKLLDILAGTWAKIGELQAHLDPERHPPGEISLVPLVQHKLRSVHHPTVEVLVGDTVVARLEFEVELSLSLEGVILKIRNGEIIGVGSENCFGRGVLKLAGAALVDKRTPKYTIPGALEFEDGIPIPKLLNTA